MGNAAQVEDLKRQLEELEERAELLDKERSKGLSAIRWGRVGVRSAVCCEMKGYGTHIALILSIALHLLTALLMRGTDREM